MGVRRSVGTFVAVVGPTAGLATAAAKSNASGRGAGTLGCVARRAGVGFA